MAKERAADFIRRSSPVGFESELDSPYGYETNMMKIKEQVDTD